MAAFERKAYEHLKLGKFVTTFTPDYVEFANIFYETQPFFYDKSQIWWFWDSVENKYIIVDETDILNNCYQGTKANGLRITSGSIKGEITTALKMVGRKHMPKTSPKRWVQFKNKAFSLRSKQTYDVQPNYFFTNPIPWEIGESEDTPIIDKLFEEWVGKDYVKTLYEIIAYCCYSGYPIQVLFCFVGSGRNGKSQFLKILEKFIGRDNTTTTELDLLMSNRFETFKLYKKLVAIMGETNFGIMDKSSMLKKVTGGDKIGYEKKNKDPFDEYNYAKVVIASNSLPSSTDTSDGFFRRWLIIDFPNEFEDKGKEIWETVPDQEYKNLAKKVTTLLPILLERGRFTNQGTIKERKEKYISVSNPLSIFIKERCNVQLDEYILYSRLYTYYVNYLSQNKRRKVKMKEFKASLEDEGFFVEKATKIVEGEESTDGYGKNGYFVMGINIKDTFRQLRQL